MWLAICSSQVHPQLLLISIETVQEDGCSWFKWWLGNCLLNHEQKDTFTSQFSHGSLIAALFQSLEVSRGLFQNISPISNRIKLKLFETLSDATESNAQWNKLSLQATTSSGVSDFRKTHLKRREVMLMTHLSILQASQSMKFKLS